MCLQSLFFILGAHLSKSTLIPRHSGHGSQPNSTSSSNAQVPSPSPSTNFSPTTSSRTSRSSSSSPPPRVEFVYTTEYTTVFPPTRTSPSSLFNMTITPKMNSTTTTTLTEFVTVQPSSIANSTTIPASWNILAPSAPPVASSPAPANPSSLRSAIQISSPASQQSTSSAVSTAVVIVPTTPFDSTAIVIVPVTPAMAILIPRATPVGEINDIQHAIDASAPILPRNNIYDPPPAKLDDLLRGDVQTSTVTITRTMQPASSLSKVPTPSFSTKPSHISKTQAVQATSAPALASESDHPNCPYPYPGIKCGSGKGKITLTTTSTTTKTVKSSTSSTASDWCPYPGLKC